MEVKITKTPQELFSLYREGKTYQEIGDMFDVSRERIRQILRKYKPDFVRNYYKGKNALPHVKAVCANAKCGKTFYKKQNKKTNYCTQQCWARTWALAPFPMKDPRYFAWRKEYARQRARAYYWDVFKKNPNFKAIVRERNQRAALERKLREDGTK